MKVLREIGITILIAIAIFAIFRGAMQSYTVQYSCMLPNIEDGEWIMVNKATYFFSDPERGEVIVFWPPFESQHPFIKRVIALPDDTVEVRDNKVFVNGVALVEGYIKEPPHYTMPPIRIPQGEYFVLGDNRNNSNDSHNAWTVPRDNIIGKAWFIYWPLHKWGTIKHYSYPELTAVGEQEALTYSPAGGIA